MKKLFFVLAIVAIMLSAVGCDPLDEKVREGVNTSCSAFLWTVPAMDPIDSYWAGEFKRCHPNSVWMLPEEYR